jgi:hypothetical protein
LQTSSDSSVALLLIVDRQWSARASLRSQLTGVLAPAATGARS